MQKIVVAAASPRLAPELSLSLARTWKKEGGKARSTQQEMPGARTPPTARTATFFLSLSTNSATARQYTEDPASSYTRTHTHAAPTALPLTHAPHPVAYLARAPVAPVRGRRGHQQPWTRSPPAPSATSSHTRTYTCCYTHSQLRP